MATRSAQDVPPGVPPELWPVQVVRSDVDVLFVPPPVSSVLSIVREKINSSTPEWWAANGRTCAAVLLALIHAAAARTGNVLTWSGEDEE